MIGLRPCHFRDPERCNCYRRKRRQGWTHLYVLARRPGPAPYAEWNVEVLSTPRVIDLSVLMEDQPPIPEIGSRWRVPPVSLRRVYT